LSSLEGVLVVMSPQLKLANLDSRLLAWKREEHWVELV